MTLAAEFFAGMGLMWAGLNSAGIRRVFANDSRSPTHSRSDIGLARRARTIANLARLISERKVKTGIRRTLLVQAQRLESLARARLKDVVSST